jgi:hypothetical protein
LKAIEEVLAAHAASLMAVPGVIGTAIGRSGGAPCIRVLVVDANAAARRIPDHLEGYPVQVEKTGVIRPR